jgi:serine protease inhibitor
MARQGKQSLFPIKDFGLDLLKQECARLPRTNIFMSPLSIFLALAMAENGAAGTTQAAMRKALRLPADVEAKGLNADVKWHVEALRSQAGEDLCVANALWASLGLSLASEFVATCEEYFGATVRPLGSDPYASAKMINDWVADKTRGRIPSIVGPAALSAEAVLLTNAVYFKGKFSRPFRKEATRPEPFYLAGGDKKQVPMMRQAGMKATYREGKHCEAACLHYRGEATNSAWPLEFELILVLPERGRRPEEILDENIETVFEVPRRDISLDLTMPRFTMSFEASLKPSLAAMGMGIAFEYPEADFLPMGSKLFYIADVVHRARLDVDEEGTEAAAATAMLMMCGSARNPPKPEYRTLVFDRPFTVLLRERYSGIMLFAGVVYEP